jgi:hypothetical protein
MYRDFNKSVLDNAQIFNLKSLEEPLDETRKNIFLSELANEWVSLGFEAPPFKKSDFNNAVEFLDLCTTYIPHLEGKDESDADIVGIKTTNEDVYLNDFLKHGFRLLIMVRDPRDILISSKNRFAWHNVYNTIYKISEVLKNYTRIKENKNVLIVKYEDLMRHPQKVMGAVAEFLGISDDFKYDLEFLKSRNHYVFKNNSSFGDISKLFDTKGIDRWKSYKESGEVKAANVILKKELSAFGYENGVSDFSDMAFLIRYKLFYLYRKLRTFVKHLLK